MSDFFSENAKQVERFLYNVKYIKPLVNDSCEIEQADATDEGNLKSVKINDIPYDPDYPISWVIDLEIEKQPSLLSQQKTPEKAVIIFIKNTIWVILVELKSTLKLLRGNQNEEMLPSIIQKIEGDISQILLKFPLLSFHPIKPIKNIRFKAVICYNRERVNKQLKTNPSYNARTEVRLFINKGKNPYIFDEDIIGLRRTAEFFWIKNDTDTANFEFSLKQLDRKDELDNLS